MAHVRGRRHAETGSECGAERKETSRVKKRGQKRDETDSSQPPASATASHGESERWSVAGRGPREMDVHVCFLVRARASQNRCLACRIVAPTPPLFRTSSLDACPAVRSRWMDTVRLERIALGADCRDRHRHRHRPTRPKRLHLRAGLATCTGRPTRRLGPLWLTYSFPSSLDLAR